MAIITPLKKIFNWQTANEKIPYKVYTAFLTQTGTDAPVADVLQNTIGNIVWSRNGVGDYRGFLKGAFPSGKCWAGGVGDSLNGDFIQIGFGAGYSSQDYVQIWNYDLLSPGGPLIDDTHMYIEIRVYN